jgi:hypothetical protein
MSGYHFYAETVAEGINELKLGIIQIIKGEDNPPRYIDVVRHLQFKSDGHGRIIVRPHGETENISIGVCLDDCSRICFTEYHRNVQGMYSLNIIAIES